MKEIWLGNDRPALVDDEDCEQVSQHSWHVTSNGYVASRINKYIVLLHRFVLSLQYGDGKQVDHKDHDRLNCQKANLRIVTAQENAWNSTAKGYDRHGRKFRAAIRVGDRVMRLGSYYDERFARAIYLVAKQLFHPLEEPQYVN